MEKSLPCSLERRRPLDEVSDRIGDIETKAQAHFDRAGDPFELRGQNVMVFVEETAEISFRFCYGAEGHWQKIEVSIENREHALRSGDVPAFPRITRIGHSLTSAQNGPASSR